MENNTLPCETIKTLLSAYLDGEISDDEKLSIEQHLGDCGSCREEFLALKNLCSNIQTSLNADIIPIPDLSEKVLGMLNNSTELVCDEIDEKLSAYFDGELDITDYCSVEEHLKSCVQCNNKYNELDYLRNLIQSSVNSLDIDLWSKIYARLVQSGHIECKFVLENLSAFIDKELDEESARELQEHIVSCKNCKKDFDSIENLQQHIRAALLLPAKKIDLWPAVYMRLNRKTRQLTFVYAAAASFMMIILVWLTLSAVFPESKLNRNSSPVVLNYGNMLETKQKSSSRPNIVAENPNTSDDYMFTSVLDTPPTGVLPIIYHDDGY